MKAPNRAIPGLLLTSALVVTGFLTGALVAARVLAPDASMDGIHVLLEGMMIGAGAGLVLGVALSLRLDAPRLARAARLGLLVMLLPIAVLAWFQWTDKGASSTPSGDDAQVAPDIPTSLPEEGR